jgi:hypothetical protein
MKKRKFGDGGEIPPGGRFDSDTYKRARAWLAAGSPERDPAEYDVGKKSTSRPASSPAPRASASRAASSPAPAPAPSPAPRAPAPSPAPSPAPAASGRAEIPTAGAAPGPKSTGRMPGDVERNLRNIASATAGISRIPSIASKAASTTASRTPAVRETPVTFIGSTGRTNVTPRSAIATETPRRLGMSDDAMRVASSPTPRQLPPTLSSAAMSRRGPRATSRPTPPKPSTSASGRGMRNPRSRTRADRSEENVEFKSGGMVRGCGKATRTKKAKTY